jgi:hypothetical protein
MNDRCMAQLFALSSHGARAMCDKPRSRRPDSNRGPLHYECRTGGFRAPRNPDFRDASKGYILYRDELCHPLSVRTEFARWGIR